jgi:LuxR family maltose regulon positive regulatory protein
MQIAQVLVQGSTRSGVAFLRGTGDWFQGVVCYQINELEAAAQYFSQVIDNRYLTQVSTYRDAVAGLALIYQIQGESSEAWKMVESISQFDLEQRGSEDTRTRSLRARIQLMQADLERAGRWVDTYSADLPADQPLFWLEEPQVTRVRVLLARGGEADLHLAIQILDTLNEVADRTHNLRYKIEVLALRALALDARAETSEAHTVLKQAIDLARVGGFIRVFADLGKPMQRILLRLVDQGLLVETIDPILAAFPENENNLVHSPRYPSPANLSLIEPLTSRELEVLALLRGPLSIKEIAQKLNISHATAKDHTINLYGKLGVNRRWDAVARAEELNILPPR